MDGVEGAQETEVEYNGWPGGKDVGIMKCNTYVGMISRERRCASRRGCLTNNDRKQ